MTDAERRALEILRDSRPLMPSELAQRYYAPDHRGVAGGRKGAGLRWAAAVLLKRLLKQGLVQVTEQSEYCRHYTLSEAGLAALDANQG